MNTKKFRFAGIMFLIAGVTFIATGILGKRSTNVILGCSFIAIGGGYIAVSRRQTSN